MVRHRTTLKLGDDWAKVSSLPETGLISLDSGFTYVHFLLYFFPQSFLTVENFLSHQAFSSLPLCFSPILSSLRYFLNHFQS